MERRLSGRGAETQALNWSFELEHAAASRVCVQLVASLVNVKQVGPDQALTRCAIQVWVEGARWDVKLATASGSVCPKNSKGAAHLSWLGRPQERPQGHCEHGWRFVEPLEEGEEDPPRGHKLSMAQAVLGIFAAVAQLFGARTVELGAEDKGSGKLVRFYGDVGFTARGLMERGGRPEQRMNAPIEVVAGLAPEAWLRGVVPASFDAMPWLWSLISEPSLDMVLGSLGVPREWDWKVAWPLGASVAAGLETDNKAGKISYKAALHSAHGMELALAKGVVRVRTATFRVMWLGRGGSQPAHPSVRGRTLEGEAAARAAGGGPGSPTPAVALLGVLAAFGRWHGCAAAEVMAMDDGSGRLLAYLRGLGFEGEAAADGGAPRLEADCAELARRCCPEDWRARLPPAGQLSPLARIVKAPG